MTTMPLPPDRERPPAAGTGPSRFSGLARAATPAPSAVSASRLGGLTRPAGLDTAAAPSRVFGPYVLGTPLGRSAATLTWRADDPRSGYAVVVCMPRTRPADAAARDAWLADARRAARIDHPRVGAPFDAGLHEQWPYLAFDRRDDRTLAEWRAGHPTAGASECVALAVEALEGLAFAHEAGAVHGDLQPHHWWIDAQGRSLLIGFDVAVAPVAPGAEAAQRPLNDFDPARLRSRREAAAADVLALALILHGLLAGRPALDEPDAAAAARRLPPGGRDVVRLPRATTQPLPELLRAIVDRATARDPRQRYMTARSLLAALDVWRRGGSGEAAAPLAALVERVRSAGAVPARAGAERRIAVLSGRDGQRSGALAAQILHEPGLAFELLRQVNAARAQSRQAVGGEPVVTVTRAVGLLGLDGMRRAAAALRSWPGAAGNDHAEALEQLIRRVRMAGWVAQALRPAGYDGELVWLVAMLQNLGRLIVQHLRPEQAAQARALMRMAAADDAFGSAPRAAPMSENAAIYAVLGVDPPTLADAVVRQWAVGDGLVHAMQRLDPGQPVGAVSGDWAWLRAAASAANEAVDAVSLTAAARAVKAENDALQTVVQRYGPALRIGMATLRDALRRATEALSEGQDGAAPRGVRAQERVEG